MNLGHIFRFARAATAIAADTALCASSLAQEHAGDAKPVPLETGSQAAFTLAKGAEKDFRAGLPLAGTGRRRDRGRR